MNVTLITREQREQLLDNGRKQRETQEKGESLDFEPAVKLFTPDAQCT